jgi:hypothetical protein
LLFTEFIETPQDTTRHHFTQLRFALAFYA